jgi:DnaJ-class molecular chaperone
MAFEWSPEAIKAAAKAFDRSARVESALRAAVEAQPVVAIPPCPTCDGEGAVSTGYGRAPVDTADTMACPDCGGSGYDTLISGGDE